MGFFQILLYYIDCKFNFKVDYVDCTLE